MIRDWLKGLLREVFGDDIKNMGYDFVEKKVGDSIDGEIKDALAPAMNQIAELNSYVKQKCDSVRDVFDMDIKYIEEKAKEALNGVVEKLPAALNEITLDLDGVEEALNERVNASFIYEIEKSNGYNNNIVVETSKEQFNKFFGDFDYLAGLKK